MVFTIITIITIVAAVLGLALHRFWTTRQEARSTILYSEILKKSLAWFALRTIQMSRRASPGAWWRYIKSLSLWRRPLLERWLYICLYGSFLYLAASGFFFAVFIPRGLFGYPLMGHVMTGGLFAASLTALVIFKGRGFISVPRPMDLSLSFLDPRKMGITAARVKVAAFWLFVLAGFLLTLSALLPMLPLLRTAGQKFMFEFHRLSAVLSAVAAAVYLGLETFAGSRPPAA